MEIESTELGSAFFSDVAHSGERTPAPIITARQVARAYEAYIEGQWHGEPEAPDFCTWLSSFWQTTLPPMPPATPAAVSPHAAGGRGIRWYDTSNGVVGYVGGMKGGYHIPPHIARPDQDSTRQVRP